MKEVAVELDPEHGGPVTEALLAAGFPSAGAAPWARVVTARDVTFEDAGRDVEWVLAGGVLAICGGTGPLLSALALTPGDGPVTGPVEALAPGAPPLRLAEAWPVTGVGYSLYSVNEHCIAIAGRRGEGSIVYVGAPEPSLLVACLSWLAS